LYTHSAILARLSCDRYLNKYMITSSDKSWKPTISFLDLGFDVVGVT